MTPARKPRRWKRLAVVLLDGGALILSDGYSRADAKRMCPQNEIIQGTFIEDPARTRATRRRKR